MCIFVPTRASISPCAERRAGRRTTRNNERLRENNFETLFNITNPFLLSPVWYKFPLLTVFEFPVQVMTAHTQLPFGISSQKDF
jgi:hypothetical protein